MLLLSPPKAEVPSWEIVLPDDDVLAAFDADTVPDTKSLLLHHQAVMSKPMRYLLAGAASPVKDGEIAGRVVDPRPVSRAE
jgi:hypothetical protein